ncbi:MAG: hypothetical protein ABR949_10925 [Candidatus Aquilonibacter sp.]|jgi:hypothetical protein
MNRFSRALCAAVLCFAAPVAVLLHVDRYGSGPNTIIFIPGLTCGPRESAREIRLLSQHNTVYALTPFPAAATH